MLKAACDAAERNYEHLCRKRAEARRLMRSYRLRRGAGAKCLTIEVSDWSATLDAFIAAGVLSDEQRADRKAIGHAIATLCRRGHAALMTDRAEATTATGKRAGAGWNGSAAVTESMSVRPSGWPQRSSGVEN